MKLFGNIQEMLQQVSKLQQHAGEAEAELQKQVCSGTAGGGLVVVEINAAFQVHAVRVDPSCLEAKDAMLLQGLLESAIHDALSKCKEAVKSEFMKRAASIGMPTGL